MTTIPTQGVGASAATSPTSPSSPASSASEKAGLSKDAFLKLMTTQLRHQDPLKPVDDTAFLAQMAQFTTLEQITNLGDISTMQLNAQASSQALALSGRTVTYQDRDGGSHTGVVTSVTFEKGVPTLTIGGATGIAPSSVISVSETPSSPSTPSAGSSAATPN
ncbi:flagellar hook capping FlgD N-terminal domain-containing protein [Patulibacter sp. SYSU D01012]|uniref:flagellar hook capping FlgD N-terminal domain-containing protein n=1 Tax=Patulibacter sp. SYSU D01012 TaxID=2817381 RepID=UPI001B315850|nr:flagellar hook capping FlgD N-terminal domain-containing protein [Patulibacter sp. SYSU D01012]